MDRNVTPEAVVDRTSGPQDLESSFSVLDLDDAPESDTVRKFRNAFAFDDTETLLGSERTS